MNSSEIITKMFSNRKPILAYNPLGITDIALIKEVEKNGGIGLVNLERVKETKAKVLIKSCSNELQNYFGIRIVSQENLKLISEIIHNNQNLILIISELKLSEKQIDELKSKKIPLFVEVISLNEAYQNKWADAFIIKGNEAAGRIGDETSFVLAQQFADAGLPFIVQGGMGLYTVPAVLAIGALGIIFDTQLYLTPECPISDKNKTFLANLDPTDTNIVGNSTGFKYRVFAKLATQIVKDYIEKEKELLKFEELERTKKFRELVYSNEELFETENILNSFLPVGQDISFAKTLTDKFGNVAGIINGIQKQVKDQISNALKNYPLKANSELAKDLGIKYPLIQGPMANVSESPAMAKIIAQEGALPSLALGSLFPNQARTLIQKTKDTLGDLPFCCGIIGLEANARARDHHLKIIQELKPPMVVVAAGTIDQAIEVRGYGIRTFLHTPSHAIFAEAIKADVNYLVLEGMECGGHIGILTSFVLWELSLYQIENLRNMIKSRGFKVNVAFAGGIGERYSAAMVAVVSAAFQDLINPALWVGTAYILTEEIVDVGAIKPLYRDLALESKSTMVLGETVNTRARSIPTPFAKVIIERELQRLKEGLPLKDRKHQFERDNLGATRIAALGEIWNPEGEDDKPNRFMPIDEKGQYEKGNYLIGQIAGSLRSIKTVHNLHSELMGESLKLLQQKSISLIERMQSIPKSQPTQIDSLSTPTDQSQITLPTNLLEGEGIAIIGLGGVFPDANNIQEFWSNIINGVYSIKEIPKERWSNDIDLFFSTDKTALDKSYTKIAATIDNIKFNSLEFKIPPKMGESMDKVQQLALVAAKEALEDAKLLSPSQDNDRTAVIIGNSMGGEIRIEYTRRVYLRDFLKSIEKSSSFKNMDSSTWKKMQEEIIKKYDSSLHPINEDAMPGELSNVIAGRIANVFNLRGKNMTCDAACASSLAALNIAVKGLLDKEYDTALCGGADCSLDPTTFVKFSKIGALSAEGSFPFDARANGFVMGEGVGFLVLKRLSDAIKNGDKIYAVIRGLGASSDGRGKGITAPNPAGQKLAIQRALDQAKITFNQIQLIEAHGTSTSVGDAVELQVLQDITKDIPASTIALGSIKSQIGHLKSAAGIASLIKTALALHHKILPPSINFETPNPKIDWKKLPFYVNTQAKDWVTVNNSSRIAGVSAFGFGGTNYHTILEEYLPNQTKGTLPKLYTPEELATLIGSSQLNLSTDGSSVERVFDSNGWQQYITQQQVLETEAVFVGGNSKEELIQSLQKFKSQIPQSTYLQDGMGPRIRDLAYQSLSELKKKSKVGFTIQSFDELESKIKTIIDGMDDKAKRELLKNKGIFYSSDHKLGKVAFLFPGQGSQYVKMGKELYDKYTIVQETFHEADVITQQMLGFKISELIFALGKTDDEVNELLKETEVTQPAIFVLNIALFRLLLSYGIKPDFVAGHSLGEYAALVASGIFSLKDGLMAVVPRGKAMAKFESKDKGTMASVGADYETVEKVLKEIDGYVIAANKNSPQQTVISGATPAVKEAIKRFTELGVNVIPLPVSGAFHSQIVAPAIESFREALEKLTFNKPDIPISSNVTGEMYPNTRKEMIALLCDQIASPVEWMKQIKGMYEEHGVRTFIEIGPKYVLTGFTRAILEDKQDVIALASNHPKKGAMQHFNEVLAAFGAYGYPITPPRLDDSIYTEEFRNPQVKFYQSKPIAKQLLERQISQIQFHESPFDVLSNQGLSQIVKEPSFKEYLELQSSAISAFLEAGYKTYKTTIETALKQKKDMDRLELVTEEVGITGISLGLPGRDRNVFDEKNFDAILAGQNFIDPIPQEIREKMVDKNIVRLVKDAVKGAQFQAISDVSEVIKLAAQKGKFNLSEEYGISTEFVEILDITFQLAFAAGIEALRDAGIPLTPMKVKTSVGKEITKGWALPESLRDDTGIVFASAFPAYSNLISTISRYLSDKFTVKNREEMILFFDELIGQIKDGPSKQKVTQWFENNKSQIYSDKQSRFEFSRKFLFEVLSMGHSQFAQFICARGPNTQVNAACSSTTQAISIAEDWLRTGRCKRAIVIAADDVTNEEMLEWIGSGFLAVGAATTKENVEEAALPFDKRRHGMIIGMGAVGIILESETSIRTRGVQPIVDLLGTHIVNSAFHGTRLDRDHISNQMNNFITKIENRYNISREEIAQQMVFVSHETYTPARGGSASAEVDAIRKTFGQSIDKIVIANTKGFTGHAMGAGIEDVVAIKMLEKGIVPPVANWKEMDPELGTLNLSKGGKYDIKYALRFAAGFGSQLTLALFRLHTKDNRFASKAYDSWLASIGGSRKTLEVSHKTLLLNEDEDIIKQPFISPKISDQIPIQVNGEIIQNVVSLISEKTGYPTEMIELDMHLEEDLGIDTVKMAELFGILRTKYNLPREEGLRIQDYFSARKIAEYIAGRLQQSSGALQPVETTQAKSEASVQVQSSSDVPTKEIIDTIISLISEKTGYPVDMIEPKMELEEDLGIDTVKQAEIFGILRGKWNLPREEGIRIQDYSTVEKIAQYISNRISQTSKVSAKGTTETSSEKIEIIPAKRYTIQLVDIPKINTSGIELKDKKFVLVGDSSKYTKEIQTLLEKKKAVVTNFYSLTKITDFNTLIAELPVEPTDGLVFIEPSTNKFQDKNDLARIYFIFCRYLNFNNQPIILAINRNTESFGWGQTKANPEIGSITGLTKALAREFRNSTTKIISSIDPKYVIDELIKGDGSVEVVLDEKGNRKTFIVTEEPISEATSKELPTKDDLILVTGGAQGITYEITKRIAEKYSAKLILFGRSQLPIDIANLAKLSDSELANEKQKMIDQLKKTEERLTPVKIEKEWSKIVKSINVQKAIDTLTALGSEVKYYSLDVTNTSAVKEAINKAESAFKSKITGIVHGAGLEVSKLIKDKELTDFNTVFDVKVRGFDNLLENIQLENLKFLICFSSVAGRFGNAGQVDYAAANDYLSKSCWLLRAKGIPATSICWSAWAEVGMATRGSVMTVLQHAGLTPIQVKDGIEAFINELEFGNSPEVVIAGKLGVLMDSPLPVVSTDCRKYPLIGAVKRNFDGSLLAEREFSLENDLYLNHHRFEGVPFLPGVIGLELFSEMGKLAYPKKIIKEFNDIEFRSAIKFLKDNSRKLISRITYAKDPIVTIESETENPTTKLTTRKLHFQGKIIFGKKPKELVEKLQIPKKKIMSLKEIYQVLPHGPLFQVLQSMNSISEETVAINQLKTGNLFKWEVEELTSQPLAIESGFQAMGLMDIIRDKRMGLPYQIKSLKYNDFTDEPLYIHGIKKGDNDHGSLYDFEIITGNNEVALKAEDYATVKVDMNMDLSEIENLKKNQVKNLFNVSSQDSIEVVDVHKTKEKVSKNGFLEAVLHSDELAQYHTFIVEKRKNEWLAGVYAAKLAVKQLAPELELNSLNITKSTLGKPSIIASNKQSFFISITHSNGFAVAIASKNNNLGIDLEQIQNREKEFVDELLSGKEKELLQKKHEITEELLTKIWTAKEAATKVLGTGLNIDLHDLQLEKLSDRKISLKIDRDKLPKEILKDLLAINSKDNSIDMVATISTYDDYVAATCEYQKTNN